MRTQPTTCPRCGSIEIHSRKSRGDWICDSCEHKWVPGDPVETETARRARLFLSYGRRDAEPLATRMEADLAAHGYEVWRDTRQIRSGQQWEQEIQDGLRSTQLVVALLSPHAVRVAGGSDNPSDQDGVC